MKCTACGLPLSPTRARGNCPRCGTPVGAAAKSIERPVSWNGNAATPASVGAPLQDGQWGQGLGMAQSQPQPVPQVFQSPVVLPPQSPQFPQPLQPLQPQQPSQSGQMWGAGTNGMQGPGAFSPRPPAPRRSLRNPRFGFLIAGICVGTGGLLLLLVFFLAMGQGGSGDTATNGTTPTVTTTTKSPAVTPSPAGSPSPTATTYPGQQYIPSAQMSSVQPSASQAAVPATAFKVHTTFYVTFTINSGGQAGAVCTRWYLNGQFAFKYSIPVGAHTTASYGKTIVDSPGPGYVELYWARSQDCTGQVLAQRINFTITT